MNKNQLKIELEKPKRSEHCLLEKCKKAAPQYSKRFIIKSLKKMSIFFLSEFSKKCLLILIIFSKICLSCNLLTFIF